MYKNEIISAAWANREACAFKHSHDIGSMIRELMKHQKVSGRLLVDRRKSLARKSSQACQLLAALELHAVISLEASLLYHAAA